MTPSRLTLTTLVIGTVMTVGAINGIAADQSQSALEIANKGTAYAQKGELDKAIQAYTEAIRLDPSLAYAYCCRGIAYGDKRTYGKAIEDYTTAIQLDSRLVQAYYNRGQVYLIQGHLDLAISDFTQAAKVDPTFSRAYSGRGKAHLRNGDFDQAIADSTRAIELDAKNAQAFSSRGTAYEEKGEYDKAIKDLTEAIRLDPKTSQAHYDRALAYIGKGELDRAIADWTAAIRLEPKNAGAFASRGLRWPTKGNWTKQYPITPRPFGLIRISALRTTGEVAPTTRRATNRKPRKTLPRPRNSATSLPRSGEYTVLADSGPGGPGRLPARGSHRPGEGKGDAALCGGLGKIAVRLSSEEQEKGTQLFVEV